MAYLGRGLDKISNIEVLDNITFDGSSSYSITKGSVAFTPNSAQSCLISIDGVVQATNFTVSSSTIDFGVAIPSTSVCNFFLHYGTGLITVPSDGSVTESKIGSNAVTSAKMFSGFANGITEADQWRLTADTNQGTNDVISTNWERNDNASYGSIGTGMTESSGVFTFPSTGKYLVLEFWNMLVASGDNAQIQASTTTDNSSYILATSFIVTGGSSNQYMSASNQYLVDVTNTSNVKIRWGTASFASGTKILGNTTFNTSSVSFLRLGDT